MIPRELDYNQSRLSGAAKPRQFSVLEHLISHLDWIDISHAPTTQFATNQSSGPPAAQ